MNCFRFMPNFTLPLQGQIYVQMRDEHIPGYRKANSRKDWIQRIQVSIKRSQVIENEFVCSLCFHEGTTNFELGPSWLHPN